MNKDTERMLQVIISTEWMNDQCRALRRKSKTLKGLTQRIVQFRRNNREDLKSWDEDRPDMRRVKSEDIARYFWNE